jgi:LCP family protein required for cell wall assembly
MSEAQYHKYSCEDTWGRRLLRGLYSALIPGAGQLAAGARRSGYALLGVVAAILVALVLVVLLAFEDMDEFSARLLEPSLLLGLLIADLVLLLFRVYAVVDAVRARVTRWSKVSKRRPARAGAAGAETGGWPPKVVGPWSRVRQADAVETSGEPQPDARRASRGGVLAFALGLVLLLGFTVTPHVWLGYSYLYKAYDTMSTVFVEDTTTSTLPPPTTTLWGGGSTSTISAVSTSSTTTVPQATVNAGDDGQLTILFVGSDFGADRSDGRNDTTIVASFDLDTGRIALFSLPRNAGKLPLSEKAQKALGLKVYPTLLNEIYGAAWKVWKKHPELAPEGGDPGAEVLRDTASLILGIPIDYYAVVDMLGLVKLVDVMGGVDVYFEKSLHMGISSPTEKNTFIYFDVKAGINHLNGIQALAYARTRKDSSDYTRMGRQRCLIAALMDQTGVKELVWNFPGIMDVIKTMVRTDIPINALQGLVKLRSSLKTDEMISVGFIPPKYTNGFAGYPDPKRNGQLLDYKLIQSTVKQILEHPEDFVTEDAGAENTVNCWKKAE